MLSIWKYAMEDNLCRQWCQKFRKNANGKWSQDQLGYESSSLALKELQIKKQFKSNQGSLDLVIITDYELMKEAFSKDAFMGRPTNVPIQFSEETLRTEAFTGLPWKEQRRFSLHMLRDLGFGKTRMEEHIKEEILELLEIMSEHVEKPTKLSIFLGPSMSNNIASVLFGKRLKFNDPERQKLDSLLREIAELAGALSWQTFFPWLKTVMSFINNGKISRITEVLEEIKAYCRKEIKQHEATLDPNNIRDFLDGYLLEVQKKIGDPNTTFKKEVLEDLSRGFFAAGSETVRVTVDWMLCICSAYPQIQKRIQAEIDEVVGRERFPTWQDRLRMPYTEACIAELMRWRTIVPLNLLRYTLQNTELNGYFIPKHTTVLSVFWAPDHDEKLWGKDVHEYKPERFLSPDGQKVVKPEYATPFSVGKRSCPGKSLAEIEVFLYIVAILQKFEVSVPPGKKIDLEGELGISLQPKRQDLCLKLRH
ncbi:cytochrome P450 2J6 [Trichonephila inaurata madagascariensis]|uniref:Cytochrome P450 2J6 n=1 Tax=Trichonephila inaurata madagascariensis TaxID=2747483 RepID=A0A8X6YMP8_9ARAC|nr:cytochrome P450 2J6 [Trichonephila inaurata madagascariensis]